MLDIIINAYLYLFYLFFFRWLPELNGLITDLRDKLANKQKPRKSKPATGTQQRLKMFFLLLFGNTGSKAWNYQLYCLTVHYLTSG